jgi:hypothetical protein
LPRPDIDILAYKPAENRLLWVECKSYLDSAGVSISAFNGEDQKNARRYRVFTDPQFREIVTQRLVEQLVFDRLCLPQPGVEYGLVAGKIYPGSRESLHIHFDFAAQHHLMLK